MFPYFELPAKYFQQQERGPGVSFDYLCEKEMGPLLDLVLGQPYSNLSEQGLFG
jgi:hypothetical protein